MNLSHWMLWYTTSYTLRNEQTTRGLGGGERKNSPNVIIDHPYTPRKPPACSNSNNTTISQINQKDSLLWYSTIDTSRNEQSKTQKKRKKKKHSQYLIDHTYTPCKPPACYNSNNHHKRFSAYVHHTIFITKYCNHIIMLKTK